MRKIFYLCLLVVGMMVSGCGEEKPEKETWYYLEDTCWKDHLMYRSWKENGYWKYELYNNINVDVLLIYDEVYTVGNDSKSIERQSFIKSGKESGIIETEIPDTELLDFALSSVIETKNGEPYQAISCELKHAWE